MKRIALMAGLSGVLFLFAAGVLAGPVPGRHPLTSEGALAVSEEDRCPVCAMPVHRHPKFVCAIQLADGTTFYFCAPGCLIRSWMNPEPLLGVSQQRLSRAVVQDYFSGRPIDALAAFWVAGSNVSGPMGPAVVPLSTESDAVVFQRRHGGKTLFRLSEMTNERWEQMTGKRPAP